MVISSDQIAKVKKKQKQTNKQTGKQERNAIASIHSLRKTKPLTELEDENIFDNTFDSLDTHLIHL